MAHMGASRLLQDDAAKLLGGDEPSLHRGSSRRGPSVAGQVANVGLRRRQPSGLQTPNAPKGLQPLLSKFTLIETDYIVKSVFVAGGPRKTSSLPGKFPGLFGVKS